MPDQEQFVAAYLEAVHPVLMARDVEESVQFFADLGFELLFRDSLEDAKYAVVARDGAQVHLQWADSTQWAYPVDRPTYRFLVSNVDAVFEEFLRSGRLSRCSATRGPLASPADTPWGTREFHVRDPGQNGLQFYRPL